MSPRPDWLDTSDAVGLWRQRNSLAVTLGYRDGAEVEWALGAQVSCPQERYHILR